MKRKTIWVDEDDLKAVDLIRQRFGCEPESQAWRMAVRWIAAGVKVDVHATLRGIRSEWERE